MLYLKSVDLKKEKIESLVIPVCEDKNIHEDKTILSLIRSPPRLPLQVRPPAKPARHSPEAKSMADGQGEADWAMSGQVTIGMMEQWNTGKQQEQSSTSFKSIIPLFQYSSIPVFHGNGPNHKL